MRDQKFTCKAVTATVLYLGTLQLQGECLLKSVYKQLCSPWALRLPAHWFCSVDVVPSLASHRSRIDLTGQIFTIHEAKNGILTKKPFGGDFISSIIGGGTGGGGGHQGHVSSPWYPLVPPFKLSEYISDVTFFLNLDDYFVYSSMTISPCRLVFNLTQCWKVCIHAPVKWSALHTLFIFLLLPPNTYKKKPLFHFSSKLLMLGSNRLQCPHLTLVPSKCDYQWPTAV